MSACLCPCLYCAVEEPCVYALRQNCLPVPRKGRTLMHSRLQVRKEFNRLNAVKKPKPPKVPAAENATANGTASAAANESVPEPIR